MFKIHLCLLLMDSLDVAFRGETDGGPDWLSNWGHMMVSLVHRAYPDRPDARTAVWQAMRNVLWDLASTHSGEELSRHILLHPDTFLASILMMVPRNTRRSRPARQLRQRFTDRFLCVRARGWYRWRAASIVEILKSTARNGDALDERKDLLAGSQFQVVACLDRDARQQRETDVQPDIHQGGIDGIHPFDSPAQDVLHANVLGRGQGQRYVARADSNPDGLPDGSHHQGHTQQGILALKHGEAGGGLMGLDDHRHH